MDEVRTPTITRSVTSLMKQTLGDDIDHPVIQVNCMSIPETASEKWVALTRRIVTAEEKNDYYDQALVRHIYDLEMINRHCKLRGTDFVNIAIQVIQSDRKNFKKQSRFYDENPISAIRFSLEELKSNPKWKDNWDVFLDHMVYGEKCDYQEALNNLICLSELVFEKMH